MQPFPLFLSQTSIDCVGPDGRPCTEIEPPQGTCSIGDEIDVIRFTVNPDNCDATQNSQGSEFVCTDTNPMPPVGQNVRITCVDGTSVIYGPNVVAVGDVITVGDPAVGNLPDSLTCTITSPNGNTVYQEVSFNTSGDVILVLKDQFGALQVEGCDIDDGTTRDCLAATTYTYTIDNTGDVDMEITLFERTRNGVTEDLTFLVIEQIGNPPVLAPGQSVVFTEEDVIGKLAARYYGAVLTTITAVQRFIST
jgi:hypothetical protein